MCKVHVLNWLTTWELVRIGAVLHDRASWKRRFQASYATNAEYGELRLL